MVLIFHHFYLAAAVVQCSLNVKVDWNYFKHLFKLGRLISEIKFLTSPDALNTNTLFEPLRSLFTMLQLSNCKEYIILNLDTLACKGQIVEGVSLLL
jgi:hypothetical protein